MHTFMSLVVLADFHWTWQVFAKGHHGVLSPLGVELSQGGLGGDGGPRDSC